MTISPQEPYCPERDGLLDCDNCEWQKHCELDLIGKRIQDLEYGIEYFGFEDTILDELKEELNSQRYYYEYKEKLLIEEIQEKAKTAYKESVGSDVEEAAFAVCKKVHKWEIGSQEEMTQNIEDLIQIFRMKMPQLPGYAYIFEEIEGIRNVNNLTTQYKIISKIVGLIPIFSLMPDDVIKDIKEIKKNTIPISNEIKHMQDSVDRLTASIDELQAPQEYLVAIQRNLEEIKNDIPEMKEKVDKVLNELYSPMSTTQKLKVAIPLIPLLATYEMETDVPKFVAAHINDLKNLVLRFK